MLEFKFIRRVYLFWIAKNQKEFYQSLFNAIEYSTDSFHSFYNVNCWIYSNEKCIKNFLQIVIYISKHFIWQLEV